MIFITLGNQNFQFSRLLAEIDHLILNGIINERVIAQVGYTKFISDKIEIIDFLPQNEFLEYIKNASFIITHAGTGSIINCLKQNKKVIAAARLKEFNEHIDNHQLEILEAFSIKKMILNLNKDFSDLELKILSIDNFNPKPFYSNNHNFNINIIKIINELMF